MKSQNHILIIATFLFLVLSVINVSAWWDTGFGERQTINITGGSSQLNNFTILANITHDEEMQSDFDDLRFINGACSSNGTTLLSYEFDKVINGNSALVWIKIPQLNTGTNQICMYYGNSSVSSTQNPSNTWDRSYRAVIHFTKNDSGQFNDSTSNNNHAGMNPNTIISSGKIGNALELPNGANGGGAYLNTTDSLAFINNFTIELWFYHTNWAGNQGLYVG